MRKLRARDVRRAKGILAEAAALLQLEQWAWQRFSGEDVPPLDAYMEELARDLPPYIWKRFLVLGDIMKSRMKSVSSLMDRDGLFEDVFGKEAHPDTAVYFGPYSIGFCLPDRPYRELCRDLGLKSGYGDSAGMCVSGIKSDRAPGIDGSVIIVKSDMLLTENGVDLSESLRTNGKVRLLLPGQQAVVSTTTLGHEEHHAFQKMMKKAGYDALDSLSRDLLREEAAKRVAEPPDGYKERRVLMHTNYFNYHGIPQGDFAGLAASVFTDRAAAQSVIDQRQRVEEALLCAYEKINKKVIGFALNLMPFELAHAYVQAMATACEKMPSAAYGRQLRLR